MDYWFYVFVAPLLVSCLALSANHMFHCLLGLENLNVLLGFSYMTLAYCGLGSVFITLLVVLTIEITIGLVVLTRVLCSLESDCVIYTLW